MIRLLLLVLAALFAGPASAAEHPTHIAASLVAETSRPAPGSTVTLAIAMRPAPGWHGYWKNPGDAGVETLVRWTLPAGLAAGPLAFPVPGRLVLAGLMNYVYERDYAHLVELRVPAGLAAGTPLPIRARLDWLACTIEICVPETGELATDLVVGDGAADPARKADFDRWRAALPRPLAAEAHFAVADGGVRIGVPLPAASAADDAYFFPLTDGAVDYAAPQTVTRSGDLLTIATKARDGAARLGRVEGVLKLGDGRGLLLTAMPGAVAAAPAAGGGALVFLVALGGALLGGLVLNVMPCVFPILSLKALSLARAGGDERTARIESVAYALGVVLVCVALGGLLLVLRAGGGAAGWAFQLQDPRVILVLLLLVAAIALNLAGLFELPTLAGGGALAASGGTGGAFWTGALAAFVATPCTGPFMGAALGAALVLPPAAALAVFAGLGLGLAFPFLLLGFVPQLRRRLPRPGPWMERFRHIMALPMFATALGLAWILGRLRGVDGMTLGLAAALVVALALWWVGRRQAHGLGRAWWPLAPAAAALGLIGVVAAQPAAALATEPFSEVRLAALQAEKRPVFVYFTADWCLTCKVNEKAAIERGEVSRAFARNRVAVLVGDWTSGDATIGRFLAAHGRSGVPFYLFYPAGGAAEVLPQVLTPGLLVARAGAKPEA